MHGRRHGANIYTVPVAAKNDFTGKVIIDALRPDQDYTYTVWFSEKRHAGHAREGATTRDTSPYTESLFFYGPASSDAVTTYEQARRWMNFGTARIDGEGNLTLAVIDVDGDPVYTTELMPQ